MNLRGKENKVGCSASLKVNWRILVCLWLFKRPVRVKAEFKKSKMLGMAVA